MLTRRPARAYYPPMRDPTARRPNNPRFRCPCCGFVVPWSQVAKVPPLAEIGFPARGLGRGKGIAWTWRDLTAGEREALIARLESALARLRAP